MENISYFSNATTEEFFELRNSGLNKTDYLDFMSDSNTNLDYEFQNNSIVNVDWSNYTFLVADDEELNLEFIEEVLADTGAKIILANNGKEAIEKYALFPKINLVLLDIRMPLVDGYGAMREIRSKNKEIPIIAQTAYALAEDRMKALKMGFTDYLEKPIEQMTIITTIRKYL